MKFIFSFVLLVSLLGLLIAKSVKEPKAVTPVTADVYFTATDDDAIKLFDDQNTNKPHTVWPLMMPGRTELLINLYAWGTAKKEDTTYTCPNDPECLHTRLLACAIKMHSNTNAEESHAIFHFFVCLVSHAKWMSDPLDAANICNNIATPEWPDQFDNMRQCSTTNATSDPFLDDMKKATDDAAMAKDLAIKIKGKEGEDEFAKESLLGAVCLAYEGDKPAECKDAPTPDDSSAQDIISNKFFGFALILIAMIAIL